MEELPHLRLQDRLQGGRQAKGTSTSSHVHGAQESRTPLFEGGGDDAAQPTVDATSSTSLKKDVIEAWKRRKKKRRTGARTGPTDSTTDAIGARAGRTDPTTDTTGLEYRRTYPVPNRLGGRWRPTLQPIPSVVSPVQPTLRPIRAASDLFWPLAL